MPKVGVFSHSIAIAPDIDDVAVMHEPVDESSGHNLIAKDRAPLLEAFVRGEHGGSVLVALVNELEEKYRPIATHREIPDLIDDQ